MIKLQTLAIFLFSSIILHTVSAQSPFIPPDRFNDVTKGGVCFRENLGQVYHTDHNQVQNASFVSEGSVPQVYALKNSLVSFVLASIDTNATTPDTLFRLDMHVGGDGARDQYAVAADTLPGVANYYNGHTAPDGVVGVIASSRLVYQNVHPFIDLHLYNGRQGEKMAFVVRPGGNASNIKLEFEGQDSLTVDIFGQLHTYLKYHDLGIPQAVAYQVDTDGTVLPLSWAATYIETNSPGDVTFNIGPYDEELPLVLQIGHPPAMGGEPPPEPRNLGWSTYISGVSGGGDELQCVETDAEGNAYTCGYTFSFDFPVDNGWQLFDPFFGVFLGEASAVIMRFDGGSKQIRWATFYGGNLPGGPGMPLSKAHKLAVYKGTSEDHQYVFVTGTTTCADFPTYHTATTIFENAIHEEYLGGRMRAWIGGFRKNNGQCHWATTHGEEDTYTWFEDGLSVAVDEEGLLAFGGRHWKEGNSTTDFQLVTPAGAWTRSEGSGFFVVFNEDYQVLWATCFAPRSEVTAVNDMRIAWSAESPYHKVLWITGTVSNSGGSAPLDVVDPGSGFYLGTDPFGSDVFLARINISDPYEIEMCSFWGGDGNECGYGIEIVKGELWLTGWSDSEELDATLAPDPGGGSYHEDVNQGEEDGFILQFTLDPWDLNYGTLYGGEEDDVLLDIASDGDGRVFVTGETRSAVGITDDLDPLLFYQEPFDVDWRRDANLLGLTIGGTPQLYWRSTFGGSESDRGWGMAATAQELFLCGTTGSLDIHGFPLREWDPLSDVDYYQGSNYIGDGDDFVNGYSFKLMMDFDFFQPESLGGHGCFISSFHIGHDVAVEDLHTENEGLSLWQQSNGYEWQVQLPNTGPWRYTVINALGQEVQGGSIVSDRALIDLQAHASGIYSIVVAANDLQRLTGNMLRP